MIKSIFLTEEHSPKKSPVENIIKGVRFEIVSREIPLLFGILEMYDYDGVSIRNQDDVTSVIIDGVPFQIEAHIHRVFGLIPTRM